MERINQFALYDIGQTLDRLRKFSGDVAPGQAFIILMNATSVMSRLLKGEPLTLGVSATRARELEETLDSVIDDHFYTLNEEGKKVFDYPNAEAEKIPAWQWTGILNKLEKFETVLAEEMRENATYFVPRRGIFFTSALVDAADQTFPLEIVEHIPDKARSEWRSAGRCLAFNLLFASGFHVARSVEAMLESYYQFFCNKNADQTLHGWQAYYDALSKVRPVDASFVPSEKTLAELKQMKDDYRNPVMHPRIVLSESNARMLYNNGESLIIAMAQELCQAKKSDVGALFES